MYRICFLLKGVICAVCALGPEKAKSSEASIVREKVRVCMLGFSRWYVRWIRGRVWWVGPGDAEEEEVRRRRGSEKGMLRGGMGRVVVVVSMVGGGGEVREGVSGRSAGEGEIMDGVGGRSAGEGEVMDGVGGRSAGEGEDGDRGFEGVGRVLGGAVGGAVEVVAVNGSCGRCQVMSS